MSGSADRRGKYWNRSDDNDTNRGNKSKLNAEQTIERAELHAQRYALSFPTIYDICDHWRQAYGISIAYNSEKEWAARNENLVLSAMDRLIEEGKLKLQITDRSLLNTANVLGVDTGKMIKTLEKRFNMVIEGIDWDQNPYKGFEMTEEEANDLPEPEKSKALLKIKRVEQKSKFMVKMLGELSKMINDHKLVLLKTLEATKDLYDDSKLKTLKIKQEVQKQVGKHVSDQQRDTGFDPIEVEVSDDDRSRVAIP